MQRYINAHQAYRQNCNCIAR